MHPGKPEQFPYFCSKCGQGTHSLTAHRCIRPGEMHGSRRRRAPKNFIYPPSVSTSAAPASEGNNAATTSPSAMHLSPPPKRDDYQSENVRTPVSATSGQPAESGLPVQSVGSGSRPPSRQPLDCNVTNSRIVDPPSEMQSRVISQLSSPSSQSEAHYPSTPATKMGPVTAGMSVCVRLLVGVFSL